MGFRRHGILAISSVVVSAMASVGCSSEHSADSEGTFAHSAQAVSASTLSASLSVPNRWQGGYCASVRVKNEGSSALAAWNVKLRPEATTITNLWNGTQVSFADAELTVAPAANNAWLAAGATADFGFCTAGASAEPVVLAATAIEPGAIVEGLTASVDTSSNWTQGYCSNVVITNASTSTVWTWSVVLELGGAKVNDVWSATPTVNDTRLTLSPASYNSVLAAGASVTVGFCATKSQPSDLPTLVSPVPRPRECGSVAGCDAGEYCDFGVGACGVAGITGECRAIPEVCPTVYAPVCGCDAKTYSNECVAAIAGVGVERNGACERKCGTIAGLSCAEGEYCDYGVGACGIADAAGVCRTVPEVCSDEYAPVCGCDGKTYSNSCAATLAGVGIERDGACERKCGTIAGLTCGDTEYCDFAIGICGMADAAGDCRPKPVVCSDEDAPVCACDGRTYRNSCLASAAGFSVSKSGACDEAIML